MNTTHIQVVSDLKSARDFIGQAQEVSPNSSILWRELDKLYEEIDSMLESVQEGDYDE